MNYSEQPSQRDDALPAELATMWGKRCVWAGGLIIVATLYAGYPGYGIGVLGVWGFALKVFGLLTIGWGFLAIRWHREGSHANQVAYVALIVAVVGAFSFLTVPTVYRCSEIEIPSAANPGRVYCEYGNGDLVRISTRSKTCPGGVVVYHVEHSHWMGPGWYTEMGGMGCPL